MDGFRPATATSVADSNGTNTRELPPMLMPALWTLALLLALLHTWPHRYGLNNLDAVSYLDIADAWRSGDWQAALNTYWSPAYSWVLAVFFAVVDPSPAHEYLLLHGVHVVLFCVAAGSLHLLIRELLRTAPPEAIAATFTPGSYATLAVLLFLWFALVQFGVWRESPDLIPAAATFTAAALVLRLQRTRGVGAALALGAVLGVGYLGKAAMLPVAPVFIVAAAIAARPASLRIAIASALALAAVAGPWALALSIATGRPTFGDSGSINYLWYVNRSEDWPRNWPTHWPHWDGVEGRGVPADHSRRLHDRPAVYEFATPFSAATYPMWYAPGYWYEGITPRFDLGDQVRRLRISVSDLVGLLTVVRDDPDAFNPQPALAAVLLVLWFGGPVRRWRQYWAVLVPAISIVALYAAVRIAPRFVTAPTVVAWLVLLASVRLEPRADARRLLRGATLACGVILAAAILLPTVNQVMPGARRVLRGEPDAENLPWHIATVLRTAGLTPGTPIGVIGDSQEASRWARLAKVRIVAEVPARDVAPFTKADAATIGSVLAAFRRTPARALLAERPPAADDARWTAVTGTPYWLMWLDR